MREYRTQPDIGGSQNDRRDDQRVENMGRARTRIQMDRHGFRSHQRAGGSFVGYLGFSDWNSAMKATRLVLDSWPVFFMTLALGTLFTIAHFWPASFWFDVRSIQAGPATENQPVPVVVDRTIVREFFGAWTLNVKRVDDFGVYSVCPATGATFYTPDTSLPPSPTLEWWANEQCSTLTEGTYFLDVTWRIQPTISWLPEKRINVRSNIFKVTR